MEQGAGSEEVLVTAMARLDSEDDPREVTGASGYLSPLVDFRCRSIQSIQRR